MVNSRTKGHNYERELVIKYKAVGYPGACTSRAESKRRDDEKVDLCFTGPWNVQAKSYISFGGAQIIKTLKEMPNESNINLVHLKIKNKGSLVCMDEKCWFKILSFINDAKLLPDS